MTGCVCCVIGMSPAKAKPLESRVPRILFSLSSAPSWGRWWLGGGKGNYLGLEVVKLNLESSELPVIQIGIAQPVCWDTLVYRKHHSVCCNILAFLHHSPLSALWAREYVRGDSHREKRGGTVSGDGPPHTLPSLPCLTKTLPVDLLVDVCTRGWTGR